MPLKEASAEDQKLISDLNEEEAIKKKNLSLIQIFKRATNKINTNAKYKCLDEGSEDENGAHKQIVDDP